MIVALPGLFSYLFLRCFCPCVFQSFFSIANTTLGEERADLSAHLFSNVVEIIIIIIIIIIKKNHWLTQRQTKG